ncbi:MAG: hypothetical protein KAT77_06180 [Nanoarchaeota archaeon]|nr:hypothetical protein [Nanoarchaeota archaeon]
MIEKYGLKKEDWHYYGQWEQPALSADFWLRPFGSWKKLGLPDVKKGIMDINGYFFVYKKDMTIVKNFLRDICERKDEKFLENFKKVCLEILNKYKKIEAEIEKTEKNKEELFNLLVNYGREIMAPWYATVLLSDFMEDIIKDWAIKNNQDLTKAVEMIPIKETIMLKQNKDILKIKKKIEEKGLSKEEIKNDEGIWKEIQEHLKEYEWVGTHHFWGEPYNLNKFFDDMSNLNEKKEVKIEIPDSFKFIAEISSELGFLRQYTAEIFDILVYKAKPLLESIAKDFEISYRELTYMHPSEVQEHCKNKTKPNKDEISKRKGFCFFILGDRFEFIYNQKEVEEIFNTFYEKPNINITEFKGTVASKGYAQGHAKIFLVPKDVSKMKEGDVLVTTMTTPDFVPLMKKACAIVTDVGGLLSHAAIVSRELGVPCVIGTNIGTKVLKDGDLIEVDAEKGIVKKIHQCFKRS